ncbi:MAG: hypothetical protein LUM44_15905 [Pyrinomonadaceae bacterium]|nr:hypothetical protein [Pyrinomonadaceae bacterium]
MVVILYRWRIKQGFEEQFISAWAEITGYILENHDSLGSRLHLDKDGIYYGYAQWKSLEQRESAFAVMPVTESVKKMREAILESFPEVVLNPVSDFLILPEKT